MRADPSPDPRQERSAQSDEALRQAHASPPAEPTGSNVGLSVGLAIVFAAVAYVAGIYLDRYSGRFSPLAYNEEAPPIAAGAAAVPPPIDPVVLGKKQYAAACVTCHQPTGLGVPGAFPPLAGSEWVTGNEERVIRVVLHGLSGEIKVGDKVFNGAMPSFGKVPGSGYNWRDDQIAAVLTYVRQEWGNKAGPITPEKVAEVRTKVTRDKPWTAAELSAVESAP
ncbi:MAG: cytochrome c [Opitutae bacterium]|nr:cytochrome c [Opitutae bacterium]